MLSHRTQITVLYEALPDEDDNMSFWRQQTMLGCIGPALVWARSNSFYFQNTLIYLVERLYAITLSFLVYLALARGYGPEILGQYSYVQTVMLFAAPFLASGSEGIVVRDLVREPTSTLDILGSALVVLSATGLVTAILPLLFVWFSQGRTDGFMNMALWTAVGFVPMGFLVLEHYLKAHQNAAMILLARAGSGTLGAAAKFYFIWHHYPISYVLGATAVEAFVLVGVLFWAAGAKVPLAQWRFSKPVAWAIFEQSFPGMIAAVAVTLFFRANHLLLAHFSDFASVGQYALAFQGIQMFLVVPAVAFGAIYPRLVQVHAVDRAKYDYVMKYLYLGFTATGYLLMFACWLSSGWIFTMFFGQRYEMARHIFNVLAIANIFNFSWQVRSRAIDLTNQTRFHAWVGLVGLVTVTASSLFVIPRYGAVGAAWCVTLATAVSGVAVTILLPGLRNDAIAQLRAFFLMPPRKVTSGALAGQGDVSPERR